MEQQVRVIEIDGEQAKVSGQRASACGNCAGKASCSTMGSWRERFIELDVKNTISARVGDEVVIEVPDGLLLKVAFRLYALPMLIFVVTGSLIAWCVSAMGWPAVELWAAAGALLSVPCTYLLLRRSNNGGESGLDVRMLRIVSHGSCMPPILPISESK